jgi:hypothetical protein
MQIIQIVSRLPPAIDGVGDYAYLLAKQLRAKHDIHTVFVVCDPRPLKIKSDDHSTSFQPQPSAQNEEENAGILNHGTQSVAPPTTGRGLRNNLDGFPICQLKEQSAGELLQLLLEPQMPGTLLLQYVGYGYQKRGCPLWLLHGLLAWKNQSQKLHRTHHLLTMFHELNASGPVWSSPFWTAPVQKWIAKSLSRLGNHSFTNLNIYAGILQKSTGHDRADFTVLPVFSNLGEPKFLPAWDERQPKMIVFGSAGWRQKIYSECRNSLEKACQTLQLNEIVDIGAPVDIPDFSVPVSRRGVLQSTEASREMSNARAGFFAYPINCLGKSGIFAAYAAHGLAPVTYEQSDTVNDDGLSLNNHFIFSNV